VKGAQEDLRSFPVWERGFFAALRMTAGIFGFAGDGSKVVYERRLAA